MHGFIANLLPKFERLLVCMATSQTLRQHSAAQTDTVAAAHTEFATRDLQQHWAHARLALQVGELHQLICCHVCYCSITGRREQIDPMARGSKS
jgi:hypothetical protein